VSHRHSELIEIRQIPKKGRGVFARTRIRKGAVIERVPVIAVPVRDVSGRLTDYGFWWGRDTVAIALGYGSLYNHSYRPNARFYRDRLTQVFIAVRDIRSGQEITVNYNGRPGSQSRVGFVVV
jgi:SET domain-containing protein